MKEPDYRGDDFEVVYVRRLGRAQPNSVRNVPARLSLPCFINSPRAGSWVVKALICPSRHGHRRRPGRARLVAHHNVHAIVEFVQAPHKPVEREFAGTAGHDC